MNRMDAAALSDDDRNYAKGSIGASTQGAIAGYLPPIDRRDPSYLSADDTTHAIAACLYSKIIRGLMPRMHPDKPLKLDV